MFLKRKKKKTTDAHFLDHQRFEAAIKRNPSMPRVEVEYLKRMSQSALARVDWRDVPEHLRPENVRVEKTYEPREDAA